jgi:hypothetical protein
MSSQDKDMDVQGTKRSPDMDETAGEGESSASTAKKAKTNRSPPGTSKSFRDWSSKLSDSDTCTMYTLKCTLGDASIPNKYFKTQKVPFLKNECEKRGLPSNATRAVLLERLQTELPSVTFEIDARELFQRVINSMLYYFKWDNTHLFSCKMPARGDVRAGVGKLWESLPSWDIGFAIKSGSISSDPDMQHDYHKKRLAQLGITNDTIRKIQENPNALGDVRKLSGCAFEPFEEGMDSFDEDGYPKGGALTLEQLALEKGDKVKVTYDFGDGNRFVIEVEDVKENVTVHSEEEHYGHDTRVKLLRKGVCKMRNQYDDGDWENCYYRF